MAYIKWGFLAVVIVTIAVLLHYSLPGNTVVRVVDTDVRLEDRVETDASGIERTVKDDVFFIYGIDPNGTERVFRNEDNWWYFKFDSSDVQAEAANLVSSQEEPRWVLITHYGWRIRFLTKYPNATELRLATGPDESPFPWFNVILLTTLIVGVLVIRRILIILRKRHVDPVVDAIDQEIDETAGWWGRQWRRLTGAKKT